MAAGVAALQNLSISVSKNLNVISSNFTSNTINTTDANISDEEID